MPSLNFLKRIKRRTHLRIPNRFRETLCCRQSIDRKEDAQTCQCCAHRLVLKMTSKLSLSFEQFRTSSNVDFHCKWKSFHHKDLHVHSDFVNVIEFSDDGSFFVSGGNDGRLLVWPENPVLDSSEDMFTKPTAMEKKQGVITSLAVDSENDCIFSGSLDDGKVFIHDART